MTAVEADPPRHFSATAPAISTEAVPRCPVCGSTARSPSARGFDYEIETCRNRWEFWRCDNCTCLWLDPRPTTKELGVIYPATYYAYDIEKNISPISLKGKAF